MPIRPTYRGGSSDLAYSEHQRLLDEMESARQAAEKKQARTAEWRGENPLAFWQNEPEAGWKNKSEREAEDNYQKMLANQQDVGDASPPPEVVAEQRAATPAIFDRPNVDANVAAYRETKDLAENQIANTRGIIPFQSADAPPKAAAPAFANWRDAQRASERPDTVNRGYTPGEGISSLVGGLGRVMQRRDIGGVAGDEMRARRLAGEESEQQYGRQKSERDAEIERQLGTIRDMRDPNADMANQQRKEINDMLALSNLAPIDPENKLSYEILKKYSDKLGIPVKVPKGTGAGKSSEDERKVLGWHERMKSSQTKLLSMGEYAPGTFSSLPPDFFKNEKYKSFIQASKEWLSGILRRDSGAAVTDKELIELGQQYIPMAGDDKTIIAQKAQARENEMNSMGAQAYNAYAQRYGELPTAAVLAKNRNKIFAPTTISVEKDKYGNPIESVEAAGFKNEKGKAKDNAAAAAAAKKVGL